MNNWYEILANKKGYFVNQEGVAYSPRGNKVGTCGKRPYIYFGVRVSKDRVVKVYVHRLQAYQKYGVAIFDEGIVVRHLNGNSMDNSVENISIGTAIDNAMDKPKHKKVNAALIASSKIKVYSDEMVLEIQKDRDAGLTYNELIKKYDVKNKSSLVYILKRNISRNGAEASLPL